jgi:hypothetical protein
MRKQKWHCQKIKKAVMEYGERTYKEINQEVIRCVK